jgi:hypothetical protein
MQEALRASLVTFNAESGTSLSATTSGEGGEDEDESGRTEWACKACTYVNNSRATACEMCGTVRNHEDDLESNSPSPGSFESDDDGIENEE